MARIRTIKPEFWTHHIMGRATDSQKCMAIALLNHADDEGYFLADPAIVRSACRPFDEDSVTSHGLITDLSLLGWIELCKTDDGVLLGRIVKFRQNQIINRPKVSKLKDSWNDHGRITDESLTRHVGKGKEGNREQGKEQGIEAGQIACVASAKPKRPATKKAAAVSDQEWLRSLTVNPAYGHINVPAEFGKLVAWCEVKGKQPTRSRFLGWLNRIEKPIKGVAATTRQQPKTFDQIRQENNFQAAIEFAGGVNDGSGQEAICCVDGNARRGVFQRRIKADDGDLLPIFSGLPD